MLLQTHRLRKEYKSVIALRDVDLQVNHGEIFGLLGPNGSGKTTLIRTVMGFLKPSHGRAEIGGFDCHQNMVEVHRQVAYMPGEVRLFRRMRGRQVLEFLAATHPYGDLTRALKFADRLEVDLSRSVAYCSTGMRQKIALAATMSVRCPLVILDEPTSNLDPTVRQVVGEMLGEAKAEGQTVILSSHVLSEIEDTCDRVCFLRKGELAHTQVLSELRKQHRIKLELTGPLPDVPDEFRDSVHVQPSHNGTAVLQTSGNLTDLLGWLATLPLAELSIEPNRLEVIYQRVHEAKPV